MAVSLTKGGNVSLTKEAPTMKTAMVGLGWDQGEPAQRPISSIDLAQCERERRRLMRALIKSCV